VIIWIVILNIHMELYYDKDATAYKDFLSSVQSECLDISHKLGIVFEQFENHSMRNSQRAEVVSQIREVIPQERGSIVTSRNAMLPLSKSKNLNLGNTPVLLVKSKKKIVYVFPCRIGEKYYDIMSGLSHLKTNLPNLIPLEGEMEGTILERIKKSSDILEKDLTLIGEEQDTITGKADLVFLDSQKRHLIVEVEREATDKALGQILRLGAGYEEKNKLSRDQVRIGIACARINRFVYTGAKRAGIEIWKV
jgi:hypothetical protein